MERHTLDKIIFSYNDLEDNGGYRAIRRHILTCTYSFPPYHYANSIVRGGR